MESHGQRFLASEMMDSSINTMPTENGTARNHTPCPYWVWYRVYVLGPRPLSFTGLCTMSDNTLFKHQSVIINDNPKKTGLWLGTGGGKTRIALSLAEEPVLIICPKTQALDQNWERELKKMGVKKNIYVISKETFRRDHGSLPSFRTVIVDEAETCLGVTPNTRQRQRQTIPKTSQLFEALEAYLGRTNPDRIYLATATITRSPMTVWGASKILGKNWSFYEWRDTFYQLLPVPNRIIYVPRNTHHCKDKLAEKVRELGYVGRLEDWFDVPEQTYKNDFIELTPAQKDRLRSIKLEFPDAIVQIGKRHQIENGVLKGDEFNPGEEFKCGKTERILHYAEEFPKLIIFAKFIQQIKHYEQELKKHKYNVKTLTGETKDRQALFESLRTADEAILIVQSQISAGWEWKECPAIIFASRSYSISDYIQGQGRIQRTDAIKKNLYINLITKDGIDQAVHDALINKKDFSERVYLKI
jgi:hypothetical protein